MCNNKQHKGYSTELERQDTVIDIVGKNKQDVIKHVVNGLGCRAF